MIVSRAIVNTPTYGHQIHFNSLKRTLAPIAEKNSIPSGETSMSRHRKKYRSLLYGAKNATPMPPFVMESKIPCETVEANKKRNIGKR